jgi:predicted Rossmann fold nucleotide-binding protein DprA/Smf involved in DNA uptake
MLMIQFKRSLQSILKGLKTLTERAERLEKQLAKFEKPQATKKPKPKAKVKAKPARKAPARKPVSKKPAKITAFDSVLGIVQKSKDEVTTAQIKNKTGFSNKKIYDIINRAKKQGKVKAIKRGVYTKV